MHCNEDGTDDFIHSVCEDHPSYSAEDTQNVIDGWKESGMGATTCQALSDCVQCKSWCPFYRGGKVPNFISPIALGKPVVEAGQIVPARTAAPVRLVPARRVGPMQMAPARRVEPARLVPALNSAAAQNGG